MSKITNQWIKSVKNECYVNLQDAVFREPGSMMLPYPSVLPQKCTRCGKKMKIDHVDRYPAEGIGNAAQTTDDLIANCPHCGTRNVASPWDLKRALNSKNKLLVQGVTAVVVFAVVVVTLVTGMRQRMRENSYADGKIAWAQQNYEEAVQSFERARKYGEVEATYFLSECYSQGLGVRQDDAMAAELWAEAEKGGSDYVRYSQAMDNWQRYRQENDADALNACVSLLKDNTAPEAMYQYSILKRAGIGMTSNDSEAEELLKKAAEGGCKDALIDVALLLNATGDASQGLTVLQQAPDPEDLDLVATRGYLQMFQGNAAEGMNLIEQASAQGSALADYYLGEICYNSMMTGTSRDAMQACEYYRRSAENGCVKGKLGYALGLYCMQDLGPSYAEKAYALAQECYDDGYLEAGCVLSGLQSDEQRKLSMMTRAADQYYSPAEIYMGNDYGKKGNSDKCRTYLQRAYNHGARLEANYIATQYLGKAFGPDSFMG